MSKNTQLELVELTNDCGFSYRSWGRSKSLGDPVYEFDEFDWLRRKEDPSWDRVEGELANHNSPLEIFRDFPLWGHLLLVFSMLLQQR